MAKNKTLLSSLTYILIVILFMIGINSTISPVFAVTDATVLFLLIEPGARANGMAHAFTAIANDATAFHYNPAGLTQMRIASAELSFAKSRPGYTDDSSYNYAAGSFTLEGIGSFGISLNIYLVRQMRTSVTGQLLGEFDSSEWALSLAYGSNVGKNISLGVGVKFIFSSLSPLGAGTERGTGKSNTWAFDIGMLYNNFLPGLCLKGNYLTGELASITKWTMHRPPPGPSIGLSIANMGPKVFYIDKTQADPLPQNLRLGLGWNFYDTDLIGAMFALDFQKLLVRPRENEPADEFYEAIFTSWGYKGIENVIVSGGMEINVLTLCALRFGRYYDSEGKVKYWTFGLSLGPETARLNASFYSAPGGHPIGDTLVISLSFAY